MKVKERMLQGSLLQVKLMKLVLTVFRFGSSRKKLAQISTKPKITALCALKEKKLERLKIKKSPMMLNQTIDMYHLLKSITKVYKKSVRI